MPSRVQASRIVEPSGTSTGCRRSSSSTRAAAFTSRTPRSLRDRGLDRATTRSGRGRRSTRRASPAPISPISASSSRTRAARAPGQQPRERLLLAHRADAAGHALAAGLVAEERGDRAAAAGRRSMRVVEHHDDARAERRALPRARPRSVSGRSSSSGVTKLPAAPPSSTACSAGRRHAARELEQLAQRRPERHLVDAGSLDCAGDAEQLRARSTRSVPMCAYAGPPSSTIGSTLTSVSTLLTTVGCPNRPSVDRERRLVARLAAVALDRVEQRRLLAADVGAGAPAHLDVEREAARRGCPRRAGRARGPARSRARAARWASGYSPRR